MYKFSIGLLVSLLLCPLFSSATVLANEESVSLNYVEEMGMGWNLGNTFDGFDENGDRGEESWGNPVVTKELIQSIKAKGFDSIRLPFTAHMRISDAANDFTIDEEFLNRYEEVVDWALEEDLYVMINLHHDSWIWLSDWDGTTDSDLYNKYLRIWDQLAERFKDKDERVMFESINEPQFNNTEDETGIIYLTQLNKDFYDIVRNSGGNNAERMLVLPTLNTDAAQDKLDALYDQIIELDDPNIMATIHYYSEWVYSTNIGKTGFDEILWDDVTPRSSLVDVFDRVHDTFVANGIGVTIGEYGLLGYDKSSEINQFGETLKFLEFINYYAQEKQLNLMLWDNGQHINRETAEWYVEPFGQMIENSMETRSAYVSDLNTSFIEEGQTTIDLPLTLNGLELIEVKDSNGETVSYRSNGEGISIDLDDFSDALVEIADEVTLEFIFSDGSDWQQHLVRVDKPEIFTLEEEEMTAVLKIPLNYNGQILKSVESRDAENQLVSNNSWWDYLENGYEFVANPNENTIDLLENYTRLLEDGSYTLTFNFYNGESINYQLEVNGNQVSGQVSQ